MEQRDPARAAPVAEGKVRGAVARNRTGVTRRRWRSRGLILLLGLAPWIVACSAPVKYYSCGAGSIRGAVTVQALWDCNRDVMVRAIKRKKFSLDEFWGARSFFEKLTGLPADVIESRQGPLPGPRLNQSLEAWNAWYGEHRDRLVWDPASGSIRVLGD